MVWLWIALAAVLAAALLLLGAAVFFFKFSIRRYRKERADEQYEEADSIWNPFAPRMKEAQAYIRAHTREKVKLTSFDGLELAALYLPVERPRGTVIAFHGYRSLATIDFALEVEFFHRLGYDVLLPYQRSHGESQGKYITYGVKERFDCQSWARYAARRWGPPAWSCLPTPGALWPTAALPPPGTSWPTWPGGITSCPGRCCGCSSPCWTCWPGRWRGSP